MHIEQALASAEGRARLARTIEQTQRRTFLRGAGYGVGALAFGALSGRVTNAQAAPSNSIWKGVIDKPHAPIRAKRIIHLCMAGGPSQFESFDWKPMLRDLDGKAFPESLTKGQQLAQLQGRELRAFGPRFSFQRHGKSGQLMSELFPQLGTIADEMCIIRSMHTEQINHDPAHAFMNAGSILKGRPSMGSWMLYGLGSETQDLPGFVVMVSIGRNGDQPISSRQWSAGFLPSRFQGIQFQSRGDAVHFVRSPPGVDAQNQHRIVDEIRKLDGLSAQSLGDPEIDTRISQYEMAFRMQTSVPDLTDFSKERASVLQDYGIERPGDGSFASNCLLARRLAERGVRFIQLYHRAWDHHDRLTPGFKKAAGQVDRASAALVADLKQRGLLDDTLVLWGGEFGRTPMGQGTGRDHHIKAFSVWMAGGGIKPGITFGNTDDLGYAYLQDGQEVSVHDLHATMLHLCGIDHERLSYKYQGLDMRLTGVEPARVVKGLLA
ncbi:MAG: DUF1501 domain-containing protein [Deltaproteobacteria bacterium]|nr:DUF1501 domain-containing protein [Deltaproteobacteria bacterium]